MRVCSLGLPLGMSKPSKALILKIFEAWGKSTVDLVVFFPALIGGVRSCFDEKRSGRALTILERERHDQFNGRSWVSFFKGERYRLEIEIDRERETRDRERNRVR
ncbi:hypothetical protein L1049_020870 [Liquidambar formosana]|uniref:Uncharacterized protein n=1 Tax=Liquidambar formosana TaxID=63359 RepID=A0AAP0SC14_LIQFO